MSNTKRLVILGKEVAKMSYLKELAETKIRDADKVIPPKQLSHSELLKAGIYLLARDPLTLQCLVCSSYWNPGFKTDGQLPEEYWRCPYGCNGSDK
jgi:hypothetical protein